MSVILTCGIGFLGALIGKKLKLPAGLMIGAIVSVSAVNLTVGVAPIPPFLRMMTQVIAGAFIGAGLTHDSLRLMKQLMKPAVIIVVSLVSVNLFLGLTLYHFTSMDLCTALFATTPGGLSEMLIISEDMGADTPLVSVFQLARMILTVCTFPFLITHVMKAQRNDHETAAVTPKEKKTSHMSPRQRKDFLITLLFAFIAGIIGRWSGFPGGALLFSAIATSVLKLRFHIGYIPKWAKQIAQAVVGSYVGAKVTTDVASSVGQLWPYIAYVIFTYLIVCLFVGHLLSKVTVLDKVTAAFSSAPAGASDMALIASDFDVNSSYIAVLQMVRLILVISICPSLITILLKLQSVFSF